MPIPPTQLRKVAKIDFHDPAHFSDTECYDNCYLHPICNSCYGANMLANGRVDRRDRSKCELMKIRAVFAAALAAHKLKAEFADNYINALTAQAIITIGRLYNK